MKTNDTSNCNVTAIINGNTLNDLNIQNLELARAKRVLEILKTKLGHEKLKDLFKNEMHEVTALSEKWADDSNGEWKSDFVIMNMANISSKDFLTYFENMVTLGKEELLRFAHPDHIINAISPSGSVEVIENVGEYEKPWHVFLKLGAFEDNMPLKADKSYPYAIAAPVKSVNGLTILYAGHEFRDISDGMQVKLSVAIPKSAPDHILSGHLRHFSVEWRNWYYAAMKSIESNQKQS